MIYICHDLQETLDMKYTNLSLQRKNPAKTEIGCKNNSGTETGLSLETEGLSLSIHYIGVEKN